MAEVRLEIKAVVVFVVLLLASSGELPGRPPVRWPLK